MRRNWPDLLIGLALVAVIAGIVATLLTGGSFFPRDGGADGALVSTPPATEAPADAGDAAVPSASGGLADPQDPPSVAVPGAPDGAATGLAAADPGPPGAPDPDVVEGDAAASAPAASGADADEAPAAPARSNVQPLAPGDPAPAATVAAVPDDAGPAPAASPFPDAAASDADPAPSEAADAGLPTDPYRVSVGAFGNPENAERQAATFREAGYPVFVGRQDDLSIVLVGPYAEEAAAERVADEIRAGDFDIEPVIYRYEPDEIEELAASASASGAEAPDAEAPDRAAADADAGEDAAATPVASGTPLRLQVGAYADLESAQPQIDRLEDLGLTARPVEESGLVKLLVGPLEGEELEDARVVLEGAGVEFFARP